MAKTRKPRLVPLEAIEPPALAPDFDPCGPPTLTLLRRVEAVFTVGKVRPDLDYWRVTLRNNNTEQRYASLYGVPIPKKTKAPWGAEELAIACAHRLSEYRGLVLLQEMRAGVCVFAAAFASNSRWCFCVWSTDLARCPIVKPYPEGWAPGRPFPAHLARVEKGTSHFPDKGPRDAEFCKVAQRQFA